MSMISHQCDELRERAEMLRMLSECMGAPRIVSSTKEAARNTMGIAASEMQEAAGTIWGLHCKLADMVDQREKIERLKAENAELLAERDEWHRVAVSKQDIIDRMRDARAENAKLRELVRKWHPHMLKRVGRDALEQWGQMDVVKELGIEASQMNDFNRGALQIPCLRLDYGFGEQWASVELGDGTGYVRLADYEKLASENDKLRELVRDYDKCLDTALYLAGNAGYPCMPDSGLFGSLHPRMRELGVEAEV